MSNFDTGRQIWPLLKKTVWTGIDHENKKPRYWKAPISCATHTNILNAYILTIPLTLRTRITWKRVNEKEKPGSLQQISTFLVRTTISEKIWTELRVNYYCWRNQSGRKELRFFFIFCFIYFTYSRPQFRLNLVIKFSGVISNGFISNPVQLSTRFWFAIKFCCCHGDMDIESFSSTANCDVMQKQ